MLKESETADVWLNMIAAEVRAFYFGELASKYSKRKQLITFVIFFLSSGAAATFIAKTSVEWLPATLAIITALLTSYSIAFGLDRQVTAASKLHAQWMHISIEYQHLWNHWSEDGARDTFNDLLARGAQASETATLEAPYDKKRMDYWADHVHAQYGLIPT